MAIVKVDIKGQVQDREDGYVLISTVEHALMGKGVNSIIAACSVTNLGMAPTIVAKHSKEVKDNRIIMRLMQETISLRLDREI